jgi:hypothetical protein
MEDNPSPATSPSKGPPPPSMGEGPGKTPVPRSGIVLVAAYLVAFFLFLLYCLVQFWPHSSGSSDSPCSSVNFLWWTFSISDDIRLFFIVTAAGALGSLVHAIRSVYWYVGNRGFVWSWLLKYVLLPYAGAALALIFYFVVRGGFFSPQAGGKETSSFGFAAMACLVGLFSEQAVLKLKDVAETVFKKPEPGADDKPQDGKPPTSASDSKG